MCAEAWALALLSPVQVFVSRVHGLDGSRKTKSTVEIDQSSWTGFGDVAHGRAAEPADWFG